MPEITGAQRKYLRGMAHHLTPLVQIGKNGLTDAVVNPLFGTAQTSIYRLRVSEPLVARVIVELEQGGKRFREIAIVHADSELTR